MSDRSRIEWTDASWNPVTGCTKVSAGCKNCYAERLFARFTWDFSRVTVHPERLKQPLHWRQPRRIFVCSMSDLFHEAVPFEFQCRIFDHMHNARRHTFQVLTKRPESMREFIKRYQTEWLKGFEAAWPREFQHVWIGVSVENQVTADERIPLLLQTPAAVRWVSVEPMLGPVNLMRSIPCGYYCDERIGHVDHGPHGNLGSLDWVVCGGESGPKARPMHPDWARLVRDQCQAAGVPFFLKQWGEWCPPSQMPADTFQAWDTHHGTECINRNTPWPCNKRAGGRLLDGVEWSEFPQGAGDA